MDDGRHFTNLSPWNTGDGIKIDSQFIWMIQIVGANRMRMHLETGKIRHPRERRRITGNNFFRCSPGRKAQRDDLYPRWPRLRRALLIKVLAVNAIGITDEHVGPSAGTAQGAVGNRKVIADEIEFGVTGLGEEDLARIGDRDLLPRDGQ